MLSADGVIRKVDKFAAGPLNKKGGMKNSQMIPMSLHLLMCELRICKYVFYMLIDF